MKYSDIPQDEKIDFIYDALKREEKRRWYRMYYRICMFILLFILPYYILLVYGPILLSKAPSLLGWTVKDSSKEYVDTLVKNLSPEQKKALESWLQQLLNSETQQNGTTY